MKQARLIDTCCDDNLKLLQAAAPLDLKNPLQRYLWGYRDSG